MTNSTAVRRGFTLNSSEHWGSAMGLEAVRSEIEYMRVQVIRQRRDILQLQRGGIPTASAELLLLRMQIKIDDLCAHRDRLKQGLPGPTQGKVLGGRRW
jgi:hypothetical protein